MKKIKLIVISLFLLNLNTFASSAVVDEVAEQYVKLVLAMGQHDSNYVDAYYGPEKWREEAAKAPMDLKKIVIAAKSLQDVLTREQKKNDTVPLRFAYLNTQLGSLAARALMLIGNVKYNFDQESKALYDTQPPQYEWSEFQKVLDELDKLLPGEKPLAEKINAFRSQFVIPEDKLKAVFDAAIKACRERTKIYVELLGNETFTLEFVKDKPWSGYNWYKGNGFSLIQVNTELPIEISRAVDLGCHEGYPGHHTYNGLLEANLVKKRGWVEFSVYPLFSPQSLIAEGSANYGVDMAFPGDEKKLFEKKLLFPLAGLNPELADQYAQVTQLTGKLDYAINEVARSYRNGKIDADKAQEMLQKYALMSPEKAKQRVRFIDSYGAYVINYNWGKELVKNWVEAGPDQSPIGRWKRFAKLLSSPRLPSTLN
ncbi:hypothetical protein [Aliikangiella coralliicola]|uniref:DUF885 domain-containing protein n=1 Tax=Aliikangiella coralliicola TaxID=2592383 RepID=A0A545UGM4_9GAMM|nr:hypothetical protein [Aliikangiella coralliicola]TQV88632.1 hypothetical protein FLL46_08950 [Aliikangiella coralliicola]